MRASFGQLLKRFRRAAELSQEVLAERAGLSKDAVSTLERGTRRAPYRDTVEQLAVALNLSAQHRRELEGAAALGRGRKSNASAESNVPIFATPLIGREVVVAALVALLERRPIVTITGVGGVGKTRVAIEAARSYARARAVPAWFVDLAAVRSGAGVPAKIAATLGVTISGDGDLAEFAPALADRGGILVLDNCEHVVRNAAEAAAALAVVPGGPSVLATSRERLAVDGETTYQLEPLSAEASVELFAARIAAATPQIGLRPVHPELLADICAHVEGIPLALELAAARVPALGLAELRARLRWQLSVLSGGRRDAPARQRTMHATIAWSYALLDERERALFRRLAVFAGGFDLAAAEAIADVTDPAAADACASLVDKSLVTADLSAEPVRYRILEPVRAFARAELDKAGESNDTRRAHAFWYAEIGQSLRDDVAAFKRELDNLRAALEWATSPEGDIVLAARLVGTPGGVWARAGVPAECRRWCDAVLRRLDADAHPALAAAVYRASIVAMGGRDEIPAIERAIAYVERAGDWNGVAVLTSRLALRHGERGRFEDAAIALARVDDLRVAHHLGETAEWATIAMHRGSILRRQRRYDRADAAISESLELARALRKPLHEMWALLPAGEIAFARGDVSRAIALGTQALDLARNNGHAVGEILSLANLAGYHLAADDRATARESAQASIELGRDAEPRISLAAFLHLAALEAGDGDADRAAILKGYFDAASAREELTLDATETSSYTLLAAMLAHRLSTADRTAREAEGARLTAIEAAALAAEGQFDRSGG